LISLAGNAQRLGGISPIKVMNNF